MSNLLQLGSKAFSWASPDVRKRLRKLGLAVVAWSPYVAKKRSELVKARPDLTEKERALLSKIDCRISTADTMFDGDVERYFLVGLSGLRVVENVLQKCPSLTVKTVLDLPCGCGRVGRYLVARFPAAKITGCDLMTDGVDFCAEKLGMTPVYSQPDFAKLNLGQKFDLIWCGSLVTHLKAKDISDLLRFFERHLNDNGVVVFTAHGDYVADRAIAGDYRTIETRAVRRGAEMYRADGFAFIPYIGNSDQDQYGFSITSPTWIRSQCMLVKNWREVVYQPRGWDSHQDVYGYAKTENGISKTTM